MISLVPRKRTLTIFSPRSPVVVVPLVLVAGALESEVRGPWGQKGFFFTIGGAVGVAYFIWCWLGRTSQARSWAVIDSGPKITLLPLPFFSFAMLGIGLVWIFGLPKLVALPFVIVSIFFLLIWIAGFFDLPKWWGPGWYRRGEFSDYRKIGTPASGTEAVGMMYGNDPDALSSDVLGEYFGNATPVSVWKGGWVHDPDTDAQDHGIARKGTVEGKLYWYPQGFGFAATDREDAIRQQPTVVTVPAAQLAGVRVVPARAGADGRRRRGWWMRSPFSRLVVETAAGEQYVFDVARGRARKVAEFIEGQARQPA